MYISSSGRLTDEWLNGEELEGSECVIFTEGRGEPPVKAVGISKQIQTEHLPNKILKRYR
jgi:hypothetical protein